MKLVLPFLDIKKSDVIRSGFELDAPLHLTWTCYFSNNQPCGKCDSCKLRQSAFREAEVEDPALVTKKY